MGFLIGIAVLASTVYSVATTIQILNRIKPLWVLLAYVAGVSALFTLGLNMGCYWWFVLPLLGPAVAWKEWTKVFKAWHIALFSKKVEISGRVYTVPPHVTNLYAKPVYHYRHRYNIMFNDEIIIEDVVLLEEELKTFPMEI